MAKVEKAQEWREKCLGDEHIENTIRRNDGYIEMSLRDSFPSDATLEDKIAFYACSIANFRPQDFERCKLVYTLRDLKEIYFPRMKPQNKTYIIKRIESQLELIAQSPDDLNSKLEKAGMPDFNTTRAQIMEYIYRAPPEPENKVVLQTQHMNPLSEEVRVFKALKHLVDTGTLKIENPKSIQKVSTKVLKAAYDTLFDGSHPMSATAIRSVSEKRMLFTWEMGNGGLNYMKPTDWDGKDFKIRYKYWENRILKNESDMDYMLVFVTKEEGVNVTIGKTTLLIRFKPDGEEAPEDALLKSSDTSSDESSVDPADK